MKHAFWYVALAGLVGACSAPTFEQLGTFPCSKAGVCPMGWTCKAASAGEVDSAAGVSADQGKCVKADDAAAPDAGDVPDASAGDAGQDATVSDASDAAPVVDASDGAVVVSDAGDGAVVVQDAGDAGAPRILVSATSGTTSESGSTFTFTVALSSAPTADVTVAMTSSDVAEGTVSPANLKFTSANGSTPQEVKVTGVPDSRWDYDQDYVINFAAAKSADPVWSGVVGPPVAMKNTDVDKPSIKLLSADGSGNSGNGQSGGQSTTGAFLGGPSATNDGALFASEASNFANNDTNGAADIFMGGGGPPFVISGSIGFNNGAGGVCNGQSTQPVAASADRYAAYRTTCTGPAPWATAGCFLEHTFSGTLYQLSTSATCVPYDVSSDGRYALFTEPVSGVTTLKRFDKSNSTSTTVTASGTPTSAAISGDGRYVTFLSTNAFDAADKNNVNDLYLVDMNSPSTFTRISKKADGSELPNGVTAGGISGDGAYVWFVTTDAAESADTDSTADLYIAQRGVAASTTLASRMATSGTVGLVADISDSGQYLAFEFTPSGGDKGIWVYDRVKQTNKSAHKTSTGGTPNGITELPSISADGKYIAYVGWASDLLPNVDNNNKPDIFRVERP